MKIAVLAVIVPAVMLAGASCHHKPVQVTVRERNYYGIPADAAASDAFCVPSENAASPVVCVSIAQVRAYVLAARYAP